MQHYASSRPIARENSCQEQSFTMNEWIRSTSFQSTLRRVLLPVGSLETTNRDQQQSTQVETGESLDFKPRLDFFAGFRWNPPACAGVETDTRPAAAAIEDPDHASLCVIELTGPGKLRAVAFA
jgi:hypothetical protein